MFNRHTNTLIRRIITAYQDPERWNGTSQFIPGKKCIVMESSAQRFNMMDAGLPSRHRSALHVIRRVIEDRFGPSRGDRRGRVDIISFNDHPMTTYEDVMWVLRRAERLTRPFWRNPMEVPA